MYITCNNKKRDAAVISHTYYYFTQFFVNFITSHLYKTLSVFIFKASFNIPHKENNTRICYSLSLALILLLEGVMIPRIDTNIFSFLMVLWCFIGAFPSVDWIHI